MYVIGGWNGQCGMKQCNIFDPAEGKWTEIESLNYGKKLVAILFCFCVHVIIYFNLNFRSLSSCRDHQTRKTVRRWWM